MAQHSEHVGAGAGGGVAHRHRVVSQTTDQVEAGAPQGLVHQRHHRAHDLGRRVVRAGLLAQRVVVYLEKVFVEVQPGVAPALAERRPIDNVEHAFERAERRGQGLSRYLVVGEQLQRRTDQRSGFRQALGDLVQIAADRDAACAGHQQPEGHRLRVSIGELLVGSLGKQQLAPVGGERRQRFGLSRQRFDHFIAQQPAQAGRHLRQLLGGAGRHGLPAEESLEKRIQTRTRSQRGAGGFDIAVQAYDVAHTLATAPQRELAAVGVEKIGKRLQPLPLRLVVFALEAPWIGTFARRFDFGVAGQRATHRHRVIGTDVLCGQPRFPHGHDLAPMQADQFGHVLQQPLERPAQLVFGFALHRWTAKLGLDRLAEPGDGLIERVSQPLDVACTVDCCPDPSRPFEVA